MLGFKILNQGQLEFYVINLGGYVDSSRQRSKF